MIGKTISLFILMFFCVIGLASIQMVDKQQMWNMTETALHNAEINSTQSFKINPNATSLQNIIVNIVYKIVDTLIYVIFQVTRIAGRLAIENPQINFKLMLQLIMLALILFIAVPLIKVIIIFYVLIKDIIDERKYKKLMEIIKLKSLGNRKLDKEEGK